MLIVPIEFLIENPTDHFLDLSYLNIKFKVVDSNDSNLAADAKTGLVNYPIASLFQQVDVLLNGNLISSFTNVYAYRAMLEVLLGYHQGAKKNHILLWDSTAKTQKQKSIYWLWMVLTVGSKQGHSISKKASW